MKYSLAESSAFAISRLRDLCNFGLTLSSGVASCHSIVYKFYTIFLKGMEGTAVEYQCQCDECGHHFTWNSQPYSKRLPLGNLVLAAAAFFTACSPTRLITLFKSANIAVFSATTYNSIQSSYLLPAVRNVWSRCQERLFAERPKEKLIKLSGDGR